MAADFEIVERLGIDKLHGILEVAVDLVGYQPGQRVGVGDLAFDDRILNEGLSRKIVTSALEALANLGLIDLDEESRNAFTRDDIPWTPEASGERYAALMAALQQHGVIEADNSVAAAPVRAEKIPESERPAAAMPPADESDGWIDDDVLYERGAVQVDEAEASEFTGALTEATPSGAADALIEDDVLYERGAISFDEAEMEYPPGEATHPHAETPPTEAPPSESAPAADSPGFVSPAPKRDRSRGKGSFGRGREVVRPVQTAAPLEDMLAEAGVDLTEPTRSDPTDEGAGRGEAPLRPDAPRPTPRAKQPIRKPAETTAPPGKTSQRRDWGPRSAQPRPSVRPTPPEEKPEEPSSPQRKWGPRGKAATTGAARRPGTERSQPKEDLPASRVRRGGAAQRPGAARPGGRPAWAERRGGYAPKTSAEPSPQIYGVLERLLAQQGANLADLNLDVKQLRALVAAISERIDILEQSGDPSMRVALQVLLTQVIAQTLPGAAAEESDTEGE